MASWMVHLRVADELLKKIENLDEQGQRSKQLEQILESENQIMLVAEDAGNVIGFAHVTFAHAKEISCLKPQSNIYLQDLVVTKKLRSRGTGTLLLNAAKEYGKEKKADFSVPRFFHKIRMACAFTNVMVFHSRCLR